MSAKHGGGYAGGGDIKGARVGKSWDCMSWGGDYRQKGIVL